MNKDSCSTIAAKQYTNNELKNEWPFVVTINDSYCTYEYTFVTTQEISIYDIVEKIAKKLKCEIPEGKLV